MIKKGQVGVFLGLVMCPRVEAAPFSCSMWNTPDFFQHASPQEGARCLKAEPDPNARDKKGMISLHYAAWDKNNPAIIMTLLDAGANRTNRAASLGTDC